MNKKNKKLDFSKCINTRIINTLSKKDLNKVYNILKKIK